MLEILSYSFLSELEERRPCWCIVRQGMAISEGDPARTLGNASLDTVVMMRLDDRK